MNIGNTDPAFDIGTYGIGQPVRRTEDPMLVSGKGRYTDDISLSGQAYAVIVRSTHAHGVIRSIDVSTALKMPGVLGAYTAKDLTEYAPFTTILPFKSRDGSDIKKPMRGGLAADKVRFVGDPVAFVVAETVSQAKDAAEAVVVDVDPLPAVCEMTEASKPGAPQLYDNVPNNLVLDFHWGDSEKVAAAFANAAHVTKQRFINNRVVVAQMEPRSAIAEYDPKEDRWTFHVGSQGVFNMRDMIAAILRVPPEKVQVLTGNVGGSFGMKYVAYPEYFCVLHAARALGRPVKWTDDRSGSFMSDSQGRGTDVTGELALDANGNFLALRLTCFGDVGNYLTPINGGMSTMGTLRNINSLYKTPLIEMSTKVVLTNTTVIGSYRGAGRPESNYYVERLIDLTAREMGIDRIELRRRNLIRPEQIPFRTVTGLIYDSGDFPAVMKHALDTADVKGFNKRKRESRKRSRLRGLGVGCFLEATGPEGKETCAIRFERNGDVTLPQGLLDYGQGHAATFAQVLTQYLGVPFDRIRLLQGDSDELIAGVATGGSRSAYGGAAVIVKASELVIAKGKQIAGAILEASPSDIEFANGRFVITGTDRAIGIMELAAKLHQGVRLPDGVPTSLDVKESISIPPSNFPNGCHVCEVEIDPETGETQVVKYTAVNDTGVLINPLLVEGQIHGGVMQGIGQALMERVVYDKDGQYLTGSFMDYALPRASNAPDFAVESHPVPSTTNPIGAKGAGEAGCAGSLTSVMNAMVDALSEYGIHHLDMPATPDRVWQAIRDTKANRKSR